MSNHGLHADFNSFAQYKVTISDGKVGLIL